MKKGNMVPVPSKGSTENGAEEINRARDQQAATQEILKAISQSRDDEQPVFDLIVKMAWELCGTSIACWWRTR